MSWLRGVSSCCARKTTFGNLFTASFHKEHEAHYVDYNVLRARLRMHKRALRSMQSGDGPTTTISSFNDEFAHALTSALDCAYNHYKSKIIDYEEHIGILTAQYTAAKNLSDRSYSKAERVGFIRVYV